MTECYQPRHGNHKAWPKLGSRRPGIPPSSPSPDFAWAYASVVFAVGDSDTFSALFHWYAATAGRMSSGLFFWFIRAALALEVATILCGLFFKSCRQSLNAAAIKGINWTVFILAWLVMAALPLQLLPVRPQQKPWILAAAQIALILLTPRLAGLLVNIEGHRIILMICMFGLLGLFLLIQLLFL
jgi:hypothetical protein